MCGFIIVQFIEELTDNHADWPDESPHFSRTLQELPHVTQVISANVTLQELPHVSGVISANVTLLRPVPRHPQVQAGSVRPGGNAWNQVKWL